MSITDRGQRNVIFFYQVSSKQFIVFQGQHVCVKEALKENEEIKNLILIIKDDNNSYTHYSFLLITRFLIKM